MATDGYEYWRAALEGNFGPVHEGDPQIGFYRQTISKYDIDRPVAIYKDAGSGDIVALAGFDNAKKLVEAAEIWTSVCQNPIDYEAYQKAFAEGRFEDTIESAGIGHNQSDDPREALALELEGEKEIALTILGNDIDSDEKADKAAVWSKKLSNIAKKADDQRKVEKQPHLDAGAAVDAHWNPIRDDAKDLATRLKRHLDGWLHKKKAEEAERQRKAQEEADRKRLAAEEAARKAQESDQDEAAKAEAERLAQEAKEAEKATEERNASAGRTGAKVAMRTFTSAEITDFDALLAALKDRDEIKELVQSLANRAAKADIELPGMKIVKEQRAA